jgi:hypothetical protein
MANQTPPPVWKDLVQESPLWTRLGPNDTAREHKRRLWVAEFYDLVLADTRLLQYFVGVLTRSAGYSRRGELIGPLAVPDDGLDRGGLEDHLGQVVDWILQRPDVPAPDLDGLAAAHQPLDIKPAAFFLTKGYFGEAGVRVRVPLDVVEPADAAWWKVCRLVVARWAVAGV